jgi:hypothetical protein
LCAAKILVAAKDVSSAIHPRRTQLSHPEGPLITRICADDADSEHGWSEALINRIANVLLFVRREDLGYGQRPLRVIRFHIREIRGLFCM